MKNVYLLFRVQLLGFFGMNAVKYSKDDTQKKRARKVLGVTAVSCLAFLYMSAQYSLMMSLSFKQIGRLDMLPPIIFIAASAIALFFTAYRASTTLYGFKDFDIIASLPVTSAQIAASRILLLYSITAMYVVFLLVPMAVVYSIQAGAGVIFWVNFLISLPFVPLIPIVIAALLGAVVAYASTFFKRTGGIQTILSVLLLVAVMLLSFSSQNIVNEQFALAAQGVTAGIKTAYFPAAWYTSALCNGSFGSLLMFILLSVALFVVFSFIIGVKLKSINSAITAKRTRSNYKLVSSAAVRSSQLSALYKKEIKKFFSSTNYFMNMGVGMIMLLLVCGAALLGKGSFASMISDPTISASITRIMPFAFAFFIYMSAPAACSISLEGKNLWQLQVLPVDAKTVLLSKVLMNFTVTVPPTVLACVLMLFAFDFTAFQTVMMFVIPLVCCAFGAFSAILINLHFPMLEWSSEIVPIKQSTATMITTLGFMPLSILPVVAVGYFKDLYFVIAPVLGIVLACAAVLEYKVVCNAKTAERFRKLGS